MTKPTSSILASFVAIPLLIAASPESPRVTDSAPLPPDSLRFEVHSFKGMRYELNVRGQEVLYRCVPYGQEIYARWANVTISPQQSAALFRDLDRLGAFEWAERYDGPGVDGEGWYLEAQVKGRYLRSFGSNAQPSQMGQVIDRVAQLLGRFQFGFSGALKNPPDNCLIPTVPVRNGTQNSHNSPNQRVQRTTGAPSIRTWSVRRRLRARRR